MAFNRLLDAEIDARNPRTSARHIPAGLLSKRFTWGFVIVSSLVFCAAAAALGSLCLKLAPVALAVIVIAGVGGYRYFSRTRPKQIESIAVMPLVNASGDDDSE
jgi:4-hydroxybenzoate polyprenyltransferase